MKLATIAGTRPEIIRLSRVIAACDAHFDHVLIHTGQSHDYELSQIFFDDLEIRRPDHFLEAARSTAAETIARVIESSDRVLREIRPDAVLALGDTNSCLAALPAKRLRIPVFHMEAGNRCFDDRVPEEINRRIVDHISDINLPYSSIAREYLLREGIPSDRVIKTGSPMFEILHHYLAKIEASDVLERLGLTAGKYFAVSCHREENVDDPVQLGKLVGLLNGLARNFGQPVIVSTHPRTRKKLAASGHSLHEGVSLKAPLGFCDYVQLEKKSRATLSDSGTITEESAILCFPALNLREAHERPEGMEEAAVMMTGLSEERALEALKILESQPTDAWRPVADYHIPNVSAKVVRIIQSYVDYVRRVVWRM
jgi:UDP-N-acetyl-L-fucosamine synthase